MSLAEDFKVASARWAEKTCNISHHDIAEELCAVQVRYDIVDTTRWGHVVEYVYKRANEYVSVIYTEGSGDSEYDYEPEIKEVFRVTKTVMDYIPEERAL